MVTTNEYLFGWKGHLDSLNDLLLKWRYIRDMPIDNMPVYEGAGGLSYPTELKEVAITQIDLLQSALHNIEHEIMGIKCNCKRVKVNE